jgi:hypothetical protein
VVFTVEDPEKQGGDNRRTANLSPEVSGVPICFAVLAELGWGLSGVLL